MEYADFSVAARVRIESMPKKHQEAAKALYRIGFEDGKAALQSDIVSAVASTGLVEALRDWYPQE